MVITTTCFTFRRTDSDASFDTKFFEGEEYSTESDMDETDCVPSEAGVYQAKTVSKPINSSKIVNIRTQPVSTSI